MTDSLFKATETQKELFSKINSSREILDQRPGFHFSTPGGWCNDPNGFSQYNGKVHLFYQYHPYSTKWGPMHWGHVVSEDMINWKLLPVALAPDSSADLKGCFSGTAIQDEKDHFLVYTGVSSNGKIDIQNQCIAVGNGEIYQKSEKNPILTAKDIPFEFNKEHFRDPKIWKKDGIYYMACVIKQLNDCGAIVMFESKDKTNWKYKGILDTSKDGLSKMWECPDVLSLDGKDLLIFSPQEVQENYDSGFHNGNNSVYVSGELNYQDCKFYREIRNENGYTAAQIDCGIDFYAPETTKLSDGRTIMIGWMQSWESYITPENYLWSGMMTIPRELSFKNGRLYQLPVRELEKYKINQKSLEIDSGKSVEVFSKQKRHFEMDVKIPAKTSGNVKIVLGRKEKVELEINLTKKFIAFDRNSSLNPGNISYRKAKLESEEIELQILGDTCSLEVFINEGKMAFTNTFFLSENESDLILENNSTEKIDCNFWEIKSFD